MREGRGANGIGGGSWADHCIGSIGNVERGVGVIHRKAHREKRSVCSAQNVRDEFRDLTVHKTNYEELRDLAERGPRTEKKLDRE